MPDSLGARTLWWGSALAAGVLCARHLAPPAPTKPPRPTWADKYAERILFTEEQIAAGIDGLAARLTADYGGRRATPLLLVGVLNGVYMTCASPVPTARCPTLAPHHPSGRLRVV